MDFFSILTLVGGLAMFLYGMQVMGDGLEKLSFIGNHSYGSRLRKLGNHASVPGCWLYYGRKYRYYCYRMDSQPGRN